MEIIGTFYLPNQNKIEIRFDENNSIYSAWMDAMDEVFEITPDGASYDEYLGMAGDEFQEWASVVHRADDYGCKPLE